MKIKSCKDYSWNFLFEEDVDLDNIRKYFGLEGFKWFVQFLNQKTVISTNNEKVALHLKMFLESEING